MTINEILELILNAVLLPLIIWGATAFGNYIRVRIQSARIQGTLDLAINAITAAVGAVGQTFVDELKARGEFTSERALEAFQMAKERAIEILGERGIEMLIKVTGDAEAYINAKIEEIVRETRTPTALLQAEAEDGVC